MVAVVGPTGVGKTKMAIELAKSVSKKSSYNSAEIICCDSRQIYKDMDIVTAKPTLEEISEIPHQLCDFLSPEVLDYSVAVFVEQAKEKIENLLSKNILPIVVGGTGLYFKSLLGDFDIPKVPPNTSLRAFYNGKTNSELYDELCMKDMTLAEKIHKNNRNKIIRALEVIDAIKLPMSKAQKKKTCCWDVVWLGLNTKDRAFLYERINLRCEKMLEQGLLDELKMLIQKYGNLNIFEATIGYKEFLPFLKDEISYQEAVEKFKQHTRNYAKRQLSWFRAEKNINWFNVDELSQSQILERMLNLCL